MVCCVQMSWCVQMVVCTVVWCVQMTWYGMYRWCGVVCTDSMVCVDGMWLLCTDGIPVDVYKPTNLGKNPPVLIVYHGGGLVIGDRSFTELQCRILAQYVTLTLHLAPTIVCWLLQPVCSQLLMMMMMMMWLYEAPVPWNQCDVMKF